MSRLLAACLVVGTLPLNAQEGNEDASDEEVIELSVFRVTAEDSQGYRASNATSGTRLNTAIKDVPMSLEVVTAEFIEDTGATDLRESLQYSAGISFDSFGQAGGSAGPGANAANFSESSPSASVSVGDRTTNSVTIRGFTAPFQQRMGFRVGTTVPNYGITLGALIDSVNIERNEVLRGPGALLYGIGVISGIVNVLPKTPVDEQRTRISMGVGSDDYFRVTLDNSGPVFRHGDHALNYRVAGAFTQLGDWTDHYLEKREYAVFQAEYQLGRDLRVLAEYQNGMTTIEGIGQQHLFDDLGNANNREYRNVYNESYNWAQYYGGRPDRTRITGPDTEYTRDEETFLFNVEYTPIENLSLNIGYFGSWQETERFDVNVSQVNNGEARVNFKLDVDPSSLFILDNPPSTDGTGRDTDDYKAIRYWWTKRPQKATTDQIRIEGVYTFETPGFFDATDEHRILAGFHYIEDDINFFRGLERSDQVVEEDAITSGLPINEDGDAYFVRRFEDFSDFRYQGEPLAQPGRDFYSSSIWYRGFYGVYHGRFLDRRLGLILGVRHDGFQAYEELWARDLFDATNRKVGVERAGHNFEEMVTYTSATYAVNYEISKDFSIYGLLAEGVSPNTGQSDGYGRFFEPEQTASQELGFKFETLGGKLSGTISVFRIERQNATYFWANAPSPVSWGDRSDTSDPLYDPRSNSANFRPDLIESEVIRQAYAVDLSYFNPVEDFGWANNSPTGFGRNINWFEDVPGVVGYKRGSRPGGDEGIEQNLILLDYELLDETGFRNNIEAAWADVRTRSQPDDINPIVYSARDKNENLTNASPFPGALVSFTDEAIGVDLQVVYQPMDNWQIVFSYAHVQREAIEGF